MEKGIGREFLPDTKYIIMLSERTRRTFLHFLCLSTLETLGSDRHNGQAWQREIGAAPADGGACIFIVGDETDDAVCHDPH